MARYHRIAIDHAPFYRDRMMCPVAGVRLLAFLPTASAAVTPPDSGFGIPVVELPGVHGSLVRERDVRDMAAAVVTGHEIGGRTSLDYHAVQVAGAAWQAPALALRLVPAWHAGHTPDGSFGEPGCAYPPNIRTPAQATHG